MYSVIFQRLKRLLSISAEFKLSCFLTEQTTTISEPNQEGIIFCYRD